MFYPRYPPLLPLWPGFAVNTLFYAAILWLLFAAPGKVRRWGRIKRDLCPTCAYPIGASVACTECGKPVKPVSFMAGPARAIPGSRSRRLTREFGRRNSSQLGFAQFHPRAELAQLDSEQARKTRSSENGDVLSAVFANQAREPRSDLACESSPFFLWLRPQ